MKDLRIVVDDLRDKKAMTIRDACDELAQELDYSAHTLVNYYHTKANDYPLGWEDPEDEPSEQLDDGNATEEATLSDGYITRNKLMDLRVQDPQKFEEIASLTKVTSSTLRSYCSRQENFRRWKTNNKDTLDQVRVILTKSLAKK